MKIRINKILYRLGILMAALGIGAGVAFVSASPAQAVMPFFQMPFQCGETWVASTYGNHGAIDWNAYPDDNMRPVTASASGTATLYYESIGGYQVVIDHGSGWQTVYAHLQQSGRVSGAVSAGQVIGYVGGTGNNGAGYTPHLHWEQKLNGLRQSTLFANGVALSAGVTYTSSDPSYISNNCGSVPPPSVPWSFESLDGSTSSVSGASSNTGKAPSMVGFNSVMHTFYYDALGGNLRHGWSDAAGWHFQNMDGDQGSLGGLNADLGQDAAAIVYGTSLQLFYYDISNGNLRHAWSSNGTSWSFETLDGDPGSVAGYNANVGQAPSLAVYNGTLQLFYYDATTGNLRHAWADSLGWHFQNLDGDPGSLGGLNNNLGQSSTTAVFGSSLQTFYYDATTGNLRHAWTDNGASWSFEDLDGGVGSVGGLNANVGTNPTAIVYQTVLHVFYYDTTNGDFRHMWSDSGGWHTESLDGSTVSVSQYVGDVGASSAAVVLNSTLQLLVYEAGTDNIRHAWSDSSGWHFENLDGAGGAPTGRIDASVGQNPALGVFNGVLQALYYDATNGDLRHAWSQ